MIGYDVPFHWLRLPYLALEWHSTLVCGSSMTPTCIDREPEVEASCFLGERKGTL